MISGFGWAALALLFGYLALFFWGSALAAQAAGRPVWLFSWAKRRDCYAALGFRAGWRCSTPQSAGRDSAGSRPRLDCCRPPPR